uniref:Enhancer of polycomb-like protein n=1 Tax=Schistocephalus solidus TaxID=70667 RepID=A0A183S900_SCHSO
LLCLAVSSKEDWIFWSILTPPSPLPLCFKATQPTESVLPGARTSASSVLPSTTSMASASTRRVLSQEECKEVEKLLLDVSVRDDEDLHLPLREDRLERAPPFVLPEDFSVGDSIDEDKLAALFPPSPLKHAVGVAAYDERSRRRSVQFAPTADVYCEDAEGQWDRQAVVLEDSPSPILPSSPRSSKQPLSNVTKRLFLTTGLEIDPFAAISRVREPQPPADRPKYAAVPLSINILAGSADFAPFISSVRFQQEPSPSVSTQLENSSISKSRTRSRRSRSKTPGSPENDFASPNPPDSNTNLDSSRKILIFRLTVLARPSDLYSPGLTSTSPPVADPSKIGRQVRKCLLGWERPEDSIFIPLEPQTITETTGLRRSRRIRIRTPIYFNQFVRYGQRVNAEAGVAERFPIGYSFKPTEEEVRRRRRLLASRQTSKARVPRAEMKRRLERLAAKRRTDTERVASTENRVLPINLDDDVKWAEDACTLPIGHLVHPKGPSDVVVILQSGSSTTVPVPEGSLQLSTSMFLIEPHSGFSHNAGLFEASDNITHLVSDEQKARNLHFDAEADNLFHLTCPPPISEGPVFAVQIGNYAIPLTQMCTVFVPKGKLSQSL